MKHKAISSIIFLLGLSLHNVIIVLVNASSEETVSHYASNPDEFFHLSNPTLTYQSKMPMGGEFHLKLTTPLPTLCALLHTTDDSTDATDFTNMETMVMSEPTTAHDVTLPSIENGKKYSFLIVAFLPPEMSSNDDEDDDEKKYHLTQMILHSSMYEVTMDSSLATQPLITLDAFGATMFTQSVDNPSCPYTLSTNNDSITPSSVSFSLSSNPVNNPTTHSVAHMEITNDNDATKMNNENVYQTRYGASNGPQSTPSLSLLGLEEKSTYISSACFIDLTSHVCCTNQVVFTTTDNDTTTPNSNSCRGSNQALLSLGASIYSVSSNYANMGLSSSFGGNKAIDASSQSSWSSNGDGNNAYIAIQLTEKMLIEGVGVWSRTMGTSAVIQSFTVTLFTSSTPDDEKVMLGPFDLESADEMYTFDIWENEEMNLYKNQKYDVIKLDVVTSSGGNTGLRTLEVYPRLAKGEVNEFDGTVCDDDDDDNESGNGDLGEMNANKPSSGYSFFHNSTAGWMIMNTILRCCIVCFFLVCT